MTTSITWGLGTCRHYVPGGFPRAAGTGPYACPTPRDPRPGRGSGRRPAKTPLGEPGGTAHPSLPTPWATAGPYWDSPLGPRGLGRRRRRLCSGSRRGARALRLWVRRATGPAARPHIRPHVEAGPAEHSAGSSLGQKHATARPPASSASAARAAR